MVQSMIEVSNLSKRYLLGENAHMDQTLPERINEVIGNTGKRLMGKSDQIRRGPREELWALKDIDFTVQTGEVLGIIGRNGAGKSTLLKLLSRITDPTTGDAKIFGRVGSLLEVGTGFHPELTGRENVFLNGAILGMSNAEVKSKYDEIVAFSELGRFMETPVKRYSSGMYVRLAFAVAAHLEPEVLIIDEVLAVGDAKFQSKCMDKMKSVAEHGRTVLFVSHNMGLIATLCERGIVLDQGTMLADVSAREAVDLYLSDLETRAVGELEHRTDRQGDGRTRFKTVSVDGDSGKTLCSGGKMHFEIELTEPLASVVVTLSVYDNMGQPVLDLCSKPVHPDDVMHSEAGTHVTCDVDTCPLAPGRYRLDVDIWANRQRADFVEGALYFTVSPGVIGGRPINEPIRLAHITVPCHWTRP